MLSQALVYTFAKDAYITDFQVSKKICYAFFVLNAFL